MCIRADRGVQVESLWNGGKGHLLDVSSSTTACMCPFVNPPFHSSPTIVPPFNLSQPLISFPIILPFNIFFVQCTSSIPLFLLYLTSSSPHPSGLMIKLLPCSLSTSFIFPRAETCFFFPLNISRVCFGSIATEICPL